VYVASIEVRNIRAFDRHRTVNLDLPTGGGWIVLAGRNGSGKSTLLRALALALVGPSVSRSLVADFSGWVSLPTPKSGRRGVVTAWVERDASTDKLVGKGRALSGPWDLSLYWTQKPPTGEGLHQSRPIMDTSFEDVQTGERGPWAENPRGWFCAGYGPFRRLQGGSGEAQRLMLAPGPAGRMVTLFHEDASLAEGVSWLVDLHLRRLEGRTGAEALMKTVLAMLSDGLLPDGYEVQEVNSDGLWVARSDSEAAFPLQEMSDGYRTMAALVLDITRQLFVLYRKLDTEELEDGSVAITTPGVVLIDEVETHLHVTWQRRIGTWMRKHFPQIQFIVSTHSPYVCQAADKGGLIRMPGPGERKPPFVVSDDLYRRIVYGTWDDAAVSELFGLETPYSDRAEGLRRRLVQLERKVFAQNANSDEAKEYERLSKMLLSSLQTRVVEVAASLGGEI
jgi:energy-coupling factor transporter ATP-binding protein EcfA2